MNGKDVRSVSQKLYAVVQVEGLVDQCLAIRMVGSGLRVVGEIPLRGRVCGFNELSVKICGKAIVIFHAEG